MAGPREQSADSSLDDILSSIRRIISDDLDGADEPRENGQTVQDMQVEAAMPRPFPPNQQTAFAHHAEPAQGSDDMVPAPHAVAEAHRSGAVPVGAPMPPMTLVREAPGTPASDFAASDPHLSQAETPLPRETLAPFERHATADGENVRLDEPIVLPTETDVNDQAALPASPAHEPGNLPVPNNLLERVNDVAIPEQPMDLAAPIAAPRQRSGLNNILAVLNSTSPTADSEAPAVSDPVNVEEESAALDLGPPSEPEGDIEPESQMAKTVDGQSSTKADEPGPDVLEPHVHAETQKAPSSGQAPPVEEAPSPDEATLSSAPDAGAANEVSGTDDDVNAAMDEVDAEQEMRDTDKAPIEAAIGPRTTIVLEQTVSRLLRPMLQEWLDANMPRLIEQALREDILPADVSGQSSADT